jgi:integrase
MRNPDSTLTSGNTQLLLRTHGAISQLAIDGNSQPSIARPSVQSIAQGSGYCAAAVQSIAPPASESVERESAVCKPAVLKFVRAAIADNTRRAYRQDLQDFIAWGGAVPATSEIVAAYIADRAQTQTPSTLTRRAVGIGRAHASQDFPDPTKNDLVRTVLRGVRRVKGTVQRQVNPLLKQDLVAMLACMQGLRGLRDAALILVGFAAALRRSELTALTRDDIEFVREGLVVYLRKSKTDQTAEGRKIAVPWGRGSACPVKALEKWLDCGCIDSGPIFRPINQHQQIGATKLSAQSVALIIKGYAKLIGLDSAKISGHSLRAGLVTSAIQAGVGVHKIQQQTGHRSVEMLARYIRDANLFEGNASGAVL